MLILTQVPGRTIDITLEDGRRIEIHTLGVRGNQVRYGIDAPQSILIDRHEITERKEAEVHSAAGQEAVL